MNFRNKCSHHPTTESLRLYSACQTNDFEHVESCLKKMKREDIDFQHLPNNETALHIATRHQNKEIIKILLAYGAQRSLRNFDGYQAYQLAQSKEIQDLFKRPEDFRFGFLNNTYETIKLLPNKTKCDHCSLTSNNTFYEWEIVDRNASQKALRLRHELKQSSLKKPAALKEKLYCTKKGYLHARLQDIYLTDNTIIHDYFERALVRLEPRYIITAYTICQKFSHMLNTDMARNVIHDLENGCSKFNCDCLYSTEDGTKSIISILLNHPDFEKFNFKGQVYRGIVVPKNALSHYKVGSCIVTTTFLSTSKSPQVAQAFCDKSKVDSEKDSFFCIYELINDNRTAVDISTMSEFEQEEEVLILPYSAFLITKIEPMQTTTNIYLKEQSLTDLFDTNRTELVCDSRPRSKTR